MRICFVSREYPPSFRAGGIGSYIYEVANSLVGRGHEVFVIAASDDTRNTAQFVESGVNIIRLSGGDFAIRDIERLGSNLFGRQIRAISRFWSYRRKVASALDELIRLRKIQVVEFAEYGAEASVWCHRQRSTPMVVHCHGPSALDRHTGRRIRWSPWNAFTYWIARKEYQCIASADHILACSKAMANWIVKDANIANERFVVSHNFVNTATVNPCQLESKIVSCNENKVFFAGTITPGKGVGELIQAVELLRSEGKNLRLVLAGRYASYGQSLINKYSSSTNDWLTFLGSVPRDQLFQHFHSSALACFPSWWEPHGLVVLEAMASCGLVLASSLGGWSETIDDGLDGFLIEPHQPQKLADKMKYIMNLKTEEKLSIRLMARDKICKKFDKQVIVPEMERFYLDIIKHAN